MNLLNLLNGSRSEQTRDARTRKARVGLEPLEGRLAMSGATAALPVGPASYAQHASLTTPPPSTTTITQDQRGTAFGMEWRCTYDAQIGQYRLDIQGGGGSGLVSITRTKVGVQFNAKQYNPLTKSFEDVQVTGPALQLNTWVKIRQFQSSGDPTLSLGTGAYRTLETRAKVNTSYVSTPTGQIKLTYDYDCINNTGTLTVDNIRGTGRFVYSKSQVNASPGDPRPESPTPNPVRSIDFQMQGGGGDSYNGGIDVFVPGKADASITVNIDNSAAGGNGYVLQKGAGF